MAQEDRISSRGFRVTNLDSFREVTKESREIAGLYFYQVLDCLVDLAYKVSADFRRRPQFYRDLGQPSIASELATLNARYGADTRFLSPTQRNEIYLPIFGSLDGASTNATDSFPRLRDDLILSATAFAERATDTGVEMLREGVRTAHRPFKDYLLGLQGDSVNFSKEKCLFELTEKTCYLILRNPAIAAVFGGAKKGSVDYPYGTDPAEDLLVEEISKQLMWVDNSQSYITRERISNLQRAALRGTEAIAAAIEFEEAKATDEDLDTLITKCYTWGTALASLRAQPTHPAPAPASAPTGFGR